jgi:hypothetical protein
LLSCRRLRGTPAALQQFSFLVAEQQRSDFNAKLELLFGNGAAGGIAGPQLLHHILDIAAQIGADILIGGLLLGSE